MKATLTSKGQITIPIGVREHLHLKPGDVLDFDENAPFLKAVRVIDQKEWEANWEAMRAASRTTEHPWEKMSSQEVLDDLRGAVELPKQ